jgi:predicted chitinase
MKIATMSSSKEAGTRLPKRIKPTRGRAAANSLFALSFLLLPNSCGGQFDPDDQIVEPNAEALSTGSGYSIKRYEFYSELRARYGALTQSQVDGINYILANMEQDRRPAINNQTVWMRQIAYMFATVKHEVANTYQPITEYSNTSCVNYDGGCTYKGRGYVQLTHKYNYSKMSPIVGVDLVAYPQRALEPNIAYTVMSYGMHYGSFTGKKLGDYVKSGTTDYYNARRVINGIDRASLIAGYASRFQEIMEKSTVKN